MTRPEAAAHDTTQRGGAMILVAGGTGTLGTQVVRELAARGLPVRVMTRDPARARHLPPDGVDVVVGDVRDPAAVERATAGAATVVSAVQGFAGLGATSPAAVDGEGNARLIRAARAGGVAHFVLVSVVGAGASHPMDLYRMKHRAEGELRASGVPWTVVRGTAFMETWAKIVGEPVVRTGKTLVFGRGRNPINFVSAHDIARFVVRAVADPAAMRGVAIDVGGPENLTFEQVAATFARVAGRRAAAVRHVPLPVMRVASALLRPLAPALARQIHAGVVMDTVDMTFDDADLRRHYPDVVPTTLEEVVRRDYGDAAGR